MSSSTTSRHQRGEPQRPLGMRDMDLNPDGSVMTRDQIVGRRISRGECATCSDVPTQCFSIKRNKYNPLVKSKIPLTIDGEVYEGNCLICHPEMDPNRRKTQQERRRRSRRRLLEASRAQSSRLASFASVPGIIGENPEHDSQTASVSQASSSFSTGSTQETSPSPLPTHFDSPLDEVHVVEEDFATFLARNRQQNMRRESTPINFYCGAPARTATCRDSSRAQRNSFASYSQTASESTDVPAVNEDFSLPPQTSEGVASGEGSAAPSTHHAEHPTNFPVLRDIRDDNLPVACPVFQEGERKASSASDSDSSGSYGDVDLHNLAPNVQFVRKSSNDSLAELDDLVHDLMKQNAKDCAIEVIANSIMEEQNCVELVEFGIFTLWRLSKESKEHKEKIVFSDGLDAIIQCMATFLSSPNVQGFGCGALWSLAMGEKNQSNIAAAGGCSRILDALNTHMGTEDVVGRAIGAIRALTYDSESRFALETRGAAHTVSRAMKSNLSSERIQVEGCHALCALSVDPSTHEVSVCSCEEIEAIAQALAAHPHSVTIQHSGCRALKNYVSGPDNAQTATSCCLPIDKLMETAAAQFPDKCKHLAGEVLKHLKKLKEGEIARTGSEKSEAAGISEDEAGGGDSNGVATIDSIVNGMFEDSACLELQVKGLQDMWALCRKSAKDCDSVAGSFALDVLATAMTAHKSNASIQENALYVLWEIASSSVANKIHIVRSGVCGCIVDAMAVHKEANVQKMAMAIISVLSEEEECRLALQAH